MTKKAIITLLAGTFLLFLWNAVSWMILPFHSDSLQNIPQELIQKNRLKDLMPRSGVYHYPGIPKSDSPEHQIEIANKLKNGPRITMMVLKNEPTELFDPTVFLVSALLNLLTAAFTYMLVLKIRLKKLKSIVLFCCLIGVISSIVSDFSQMNWFMFPKGYTLLNASDKIVSFGILGLLFGLYTFKNHQYEV